MAQTALPYTFFFAEKLVYFSLTFPLFALAGEEKKKTTTTNHTS
jgi:hypothetical protein